MRKKNKANKQTKQTKQATNRNKINIYKQTNTWNKTTHQNTQPKI